MNPLLITNDFPPNRPGGMTNYFVGIATHYPGGRLVVLTGKAEDSPYNGEAIVHRVKWNRRLRSKILQIPFWTAAALKLARRYRLDAVYCGNVSPFRHVGQLLNRIVGLPYVLVFFGNDILHLAKRAEGRACYQKALQRNFSRMSAAIGCSHYTALLAHEKLGIPTEKLIVCPPGVDDRFLGMEVDPPALSRKSIRLVSVGRLTPRKGFDTVIKAMPLLLEKGYNATYTIIGKGDQSALMQSANENGVLDRIRFIGFASDDDKAQHLCNADIFLMISRLCGETDVEGFGIVFLEAAAARKPSIGSRSGGITDAVVHEHTGLLVEDPSKPSLVADAVARLVEHPAWAKQLANNAYARVNSDFNWRQITSRLDDAVQSKIDTKK